MANLKAPHHHLQLMMMRFLESSNVDLLQYKFIIFLLILLTKTTMTRNPPFVLSFSFSEPITPRTRVPTYHQQPPPSFQISRSFQHALSRTYGNVPSFSHKINRPQQIFFKDFNLFVSSPSSSMSNNGSPSKEDAVAAHDDIYQKIEETTYNVTTANPNVAKNNQRKHTPFFSSLGTIIRKVFISPLRHLQRLLFRSATKSVATFITAVVEEPSCNKALASVIMRGCNMVLTSNKLKERLVVAQTTLSNTEPSLAKLTGEDFFKIVLNFVQGLVFDSDDFEYNATTKAADDDE